MSSEDSIDLTLGVSSARESPRVNHLKQFIFGSSYQLEQDLKTRLETITKQLAGDTENTNRLLAALLIVLNTQSNLASYKLSVDDESFDFSDDDDIKAIEDLTALLNDPVNFYKHESDFRSQYFNPNVFFKQQLRHVVCHHVLDTLAHIVDKEQFSQKHAMHAPALKQGIQAARTTINQLSVLNHASAGVKSGIKNSMSTSKNGSVIFASTLALSATAIAIGVVSLHSPAAPVGIALVLGGLVTGLTASALFFAQNSGLMKKTFNHLRPVLNAVPLANLRTKLQLSQPKNALDVDELETNDTGNNDTVNMVKHGLFNVAASAAAQKDRQHSKDVAKTIEPGVALFKKALRH